ncbi:MAG: hypothetical protein KA213_07685 [Flavobacterium sp.]|nr:hypothetical protein [Flavobacterium sp.]
MKSIIKLLVVLVISSTTYGQKYAKVNNTAEFKKNVTDTLPAVVIKRVGEDFSIYIPEIDSPDVKIKMIQKEFIAYDLGKDAEGYDEFLVTLSIKDASLVARYNEKGKLMGVVEKYDNVRMPNDVVINILKHYPDWKIVKDRYSYSQNDGNITKKQYDVVLEKDNKTKRVVYNSNGELIKEK